MMYRILTPLLMFKKNSTKCSIRRGGASPPSPIHHHHRVPHHHYHWHLLEASGAVNIGDAALAPCFCHLRSYDEDDDGGDHGDDDDDVHDHGDGEGEDDDVENDNDKSSSSSKTYFPRWGPSKFSILLDRAATTIIIYNNFFSQRGGAPAQEAHCTSICTSEELRRPRLEKGHREAEGPW